MKIPVRLYKKGGEGTYDVPLEADIVQWLKKQGDHVEEGEELCVLEADKGAFSLVSPASGIIAVIHYSEGTIWRRGQFEMVGDTLYYDPPLCTIENETTTDIHVSDSVAPLKASSILADTAEKISDSPQNKKQKIRIFARAATLMQKHNIVWEDIVSFFPDAREIDEKIIEQCIVLRGKNLVSADVVHAVPLARHRAREHYIDLAGEKGSGEGGLVLLQDVEKRLRQRVRQAVDKQLQQPNHHVLQDEVHLAPSSLWRTVARNITEGARIPTVSADAGFTFDVGSLIEFHLKHREVVPYASWFPIMAALVRTLAREEFILFNSYWKEEESVRDDAGVILPAVVVARRHVHMGIAYDRGEFPQIDWHTKTICGERLKIVVLRNADAKSLGELAASTQQLLRAADEKKLSREDLLGYTFIFNNLGALGLKEGSSLMAGKISGMANLGKLDFVLRKGSFQIFFDHRMIDGALAARFIRAVHKEMVECVIPEMEILFLEK